MIIEKKLLDIISYDDDVDVEYAIEILDAASAIDIHGGAVDTLHAIMNRGPLQSDSIPSKAGLAILLEHRLVTQCVINGNEDNYVATIKGWHTYKYRYAS